DGREDHYPGFYDLTHQVVFYIGLIFFYECISFFQIKGFTTVTAVPHNQVARKVLACTACYANGFLFTKFIFVSTGNNSGSYYKGYGYQSQSQYTKTLIRIPPNWFRH